MGERVREDLSVLRASAPQRLELGGPVRSGSLFVTGRQEEQLVKLLTAGPDVISLIAPRQSGKTTSINFAKAELQREGYSVYCFDLRTAIGTPDPTNDDAQKFLFTFLSSVSEAFFKDDLHQDFEDWWSNTSKWNQTRKFCDFFQVFLPNHLSDEKPPVFVFDELDLIHSHGAYTDVIFEGIRSIYQTRTETTPSFVLSSIVPPAKLTKVVPAGNFTVGRRITLTDFCEPHLYDQYMAYLAPRIKESVAMGVVDATIGLTGGQPYLTNLVLDRCIERYGVDCSINSPQIVVDELIHDVRTNREPEPHFQSPRDILEANPADAMECLRSLDKIHEAGALESFENDDVKLTLTTTGLVTEDEGRWVFKSEVYRQFFNKNWISKVRSSLIGKSYTRSLGHSEAKKELPRVLIINCGGTIGMEMQANGTMGRPADVHSFFQKFPEIHEVARVFPLPLMSKDGINIEPNDWQEINDVIYQRLNDGFAGIVICMGTDSMSYVASACAFSLGNGLNLPVVFTGAQVPHHLEHSDAPQNLLRSVLIAAERKIREVCVVYNDTVLRAVRAEKRDDYRYDGFHSPTFYPLAVLTEQIDYRSDLLVRRTRRSRVKFRNQFAQNIFKWSFVPGVPKSVFGCVLRNPELQGIVLQTPGIGNVPSVGSAEILSFIEAATERSIPTLVTSLYPRRPENVDAYQPATAPLEKGAISAGNMAEPAAITKFMWVIARVEKLIAAEKIKSGEKIPAIKRAMQRDVVGEIETNQKVGEENG